MLRLRLLLPLALIAVALSVTAASASAVTLPKLVGTVGPGFTISVKNIKGQLVKTTKPGKYLLVVSDKSNIHDFHLTGPGVNKIVTTVSFVGTKSLVVTLQKGVYKFMCDPHLTTMHGLIVVK